MRKQNVAVLTTARSEYYQLRTVLKHLHQSASLNLQLFVSGSHLSARYGRSEQDIVNDGFSIQERLPILSDDDSGLGAASTAAKCVQAIAEGLVRQQTDLLFLSGDRYETLAAALAATCVGIPIAHLHGGERTDGALDDACRHALTKLSALHFVSTEVYRARVIQMGESPERVWVVGAPLLDEIMATRLLTEAQLTESLDLTIKHPLALVAYHPATREKIDSTHVIRCILDAVDSVCETIVLTAPNQDPGREAIWATMTEFTQTHHSSRLFANLGSQIFLSLMARADLMIGNSSSGIHESASFRLPVVNVGSRQSGRLRPLNVLDCVAEPFAIQRAVQRALSPAFRTRIQTLQNPFGDGQSGVRIVAHLERLAPFDKTFQQKMFQDGTEVIQAIQDWRQQHER